MVGLSGAMACGAIPEEAQARVKARARRVLAALLGIGWQAKRSSGSRQTLPREGWPDYVFPFHEKEELGPRMLACLAKRTGLRPEDL